MKKVLLFPVAVLPLFLLAQQNLKTLTQKSRQAYAYHITAAVAEKYFSSDSINVDAYLNTQPAAVFNADSINENTLPVGLYVIIRVVDEDVKASVTAVSNLIIYPVNNQHRLQLLVRNKAGEFISNATLWVNNKQAVYNTQAQSYYVQQRNPDEAFVKVYAPGDTTYITLSAKEELDKTILQQRWANIKHSKLFKTIAWLPGKIAHIFSAKKQYSIYSIGAAGTIVLNQPKYKHNDTVKLKAYVFNKRWHPYNKPVYMYLEYYTQGEQHKQLLSVLKPTASGAFATQFVLSDTLENDLHYTIGLRTKQDVHILSKTFLLEDYVLDEIAKYSLRSSKETYYPADTMHFYAAATDANGLPLLDGSAKLILTTNKINRFYNNTMYIPDTLFVQNKKLAAQGETVFDVPANILPDAGLAIKATLQFANSNNELQSKDVDINYSPAHTELVADIKDDSIYVAYRVNGKSIAKSCVVNKDGQFDETMQLQLPATLKVDPLMEKYIFSVKNEEGSRDSAVVETNTYSTVNVSRISQGDTLGFVLHNPNKIPVSFTVFDGNKITGAGNSSAAEIQWKIKAHDKRKIYTVKWQYWWHDSEVYGSQSIALLYKLLDIHIESSKAVYPGQKDTVHIEVSDYKKKPAQGVNLTAVSYNSQFNKEINVQEPPYLVQYRSKPILLRDKFEVDDNSYLSLSYPLGKHRGWIKRLGLDSMLYYNMLLPAQSYIIDVAKPVTGFSTQVSVHVVKQGHKQQVYMLYINRQLVYYSGVTDAGPYAFETQGGYMQAGIRLYDKFIEIDSIYLQPFYKHDIVIDVDSLPPHSKVVTASNYYTNNEINLLESSLWQLDNNSITNNGYVWQGTKTIPVASANTHVIGPFNKDDSMHFYAPGNFDIHFKFEKGYEYNLSKQILRLEKKHIFPVPEKKYYLPVVKQPQWVLGDTILEHPVISYRQKPTQYFFLNITDYYPYHSNKAGKGTLQFTTAKDTTLRYVILYPYDTVNPNKILQGTIREIKNIAPGKYHLLLVNNSLKAAQMDDVEIKADTTLCLNTTGFTYAEGNVLLSRLFYEAANPEKHIVKPFINEPRTSPDNRWQNLPEYGKGTATITGKVIDKKGGMPVSFASIFIKGTKTGTATDASGNFSLSNIKEGRCTLVISAVGYEEQYMMIDAEGGVSKALTVTLNMSTLRLEEVVVTGYSVAKRRSIGNSVTTVREELTGTVNTLAGRAAGVVAGGTPGSDASITLRGLTSTLSNNTLLYVIDGIAYHEIPANITPDMIQNISVLKDAEATALYGSAAAGGVVVVTTKTKTQRSQFRDYAFWQPQLFTDDKGRAAFEVTYPDNTTGWQTYVLGMDKHRRMGKAVSFVQAYKPVMAQLSMPQFLVQGDSALLVGKALKYTGDLYNATLNFASNGGQAMQRTISLQPKASLVEQYGIQAPMGDTLKASFGLQTSTGFKDGEERKIPVFKQGAEEAAGNFWVLKNDTTVQFTPTVNGAAVELYAQNNTLDILLDEIDHLKAYPFYCMEQTSSKLRGLLMQKKIYETLGKPFNEEKTIDLLVQKLFKAQLYNGGWPWWQNGQADVNITAYVIKALLPLRSNPLVETAIRNGLLYLQNELPVMGRTQLLASLLTMCQAHHLLDYTPWLQKIAFDSLSVHQQWQYVNIKQLLNTSHEAELKNLLRKAVPGILGGLHFGEDNYRWYADVNATTTLAFEVLLAEKGYDNELNSMIQYFLEQRKNGYWVNTVTSANVVASVLPYLLAQKSNFNTAASINVAGDTSFTINHFPAKAVLRASTAKPASITKTGGGLVYLTAYQRFFNNTPQPVNNNFIIKTSFEKVGRPVAALTAGEKVTMVIEVDALKEAEYVMMEIPIPAGCVYAEKTQDDWDVHKEFIKNKTVLFTEHLTKGLHRFSLQLECRYGGTYTLNPAQVSLMYFPTFFGRNALTKVEVK